MRQRQSWLAFDESWFDRNQSYLLALINCPLTPVRRMARHLLCLRPWDVSIDRKIHRIGPNRFTVDNHDGTFTTDFRTHWKYAKRVYYAARPLWWLLHGWDSILADRWIPQLSFGFSTLTAYPQTGHGGSNVTCDGETTATAESEGMSWSTIRTGLGCVLTSAPYATEDRVIAITEGGTSDWYELGRAKYTFDTSSIGTLEVISAATLSVYGTGRSYELTLSNFGATVLEHFGSAPSCTGTDFLPAYWGSVPLLDTAIAYLSWSTSAYNDFVFNAYGLTRIQAGGYTKLGVMEDYYDRLGNSPSHGAGWCLTALRGYYADYTGTSNDPKLVVTHAVASGNAYTEARICLATSTISRTDQTNNEGTILRTSSSTFNAGRFNDFQFNESVTVLSEVLKVQSIGIITESDVIAANENPTVTVTATVIAGVHDSEAGSFTATSTVSETDAAAFKDDKSVSASSTVITTDVATGDVNRENAVVDASSSVSCTDYKRTQNTWYGTEL